MTGRSRERRGMRHAHRGSAVLLGMVAFLATLSFAANTKKEFKYTVGPRANVTIRNPFGPVTVRSANGRQVVIDAVLHSSKVEVDASQNGQRVEAVSHLVQPAQGDEAEVDYEITVPPDATVTIHAPGGPVQVQNMRDDVSVDADNANVDVRDVSDARVHVNTVDGPITLANINNGVVDILSVGGTVQMSNVSGRKVTVNTTSGDITYNGDFGSNGDYSFMNHSGNILVTLPASASVDISARSVNGTAVDNFPLQAKAHTLFPLTAGKSFAGTSQTGASSVQLRSFSGTIRVDRK